MAVTELEVTGRCPALPQLGVCTGRTAGARPRASITTEVGTTAAMAATGANRPVTEALVAATTAAGIMGATTGTVTATGTMESVNMGVPISGVAILEATG